MWLGRSWGIRPLHYRPMRGSLVLASTRFTTRAASLRTLAWATKRSTWAEPSLKGKRQGRTRDDVGSVLHHRLTEHAGSINHANNLNPADFQCRWLVIDTVWVNLTEQVLIAQYSPIWNVVVDGFGHHDQGRSRRDQKRSRWDTLHPGRPWAAHQKNNSDSADAIIEKIEAHRAGRRR